MQKVKDYVLENGGVTVANGEIVNYSSGYQVCVESEEVKAKHLDTILDIVKNYKLVNYGIWFNESDGYYYMDTNSIHVDDYLEAYELAIANNQKAIFNWSTFESIDTNYLYLVQEKEVIKKEKIKQGFKCIICEKWSIGWGSNKQYGHDPSPLSSHGECCDECNELVLKARLNAVKKEDVK